MPKHEQIQIHCPGTFWECAKPCHYCPSYQGMRETTNLSCANQFIHLLTICAEYMEKLLLAEFPARGSALAWVQGPTVQSKFDSMFQFHGKSNFEPNFAHVLPTGRAKFERNVSKFRFNSISPRCIIHQCLGHAYLSLPMNLGRSWRVRAWSRLLGVV